MSKTIKFIDYVERKKSAGTVTVDLGKAGSITVPPVELWPDEAFDTAATGDTKGAGALVLGQEAADRFHAAGGNWRILSGIVREALGADVGESGASS